jgi:hypothetical protein
MPALPFPRSSSPGARTEEAEGRLVNALAQMNGDTAFYSRVPGCTALGSGTGLSSPRGLFTYSAPAGTALLAAYSGALRQLDSTGAVTVVITGTLTGTDTVTMAQNIVQPFPTVAICRQTGGAFYHAVSSGTVAAWPDADLPATVSSVSSLASFFLFTDRTTGKIWASGVNSTSIDALSYASAEARPDDLLRGIVTGNTFLAFGTDSIEPWLMAGKSPFPMIRHQTVVPVGLLEFGAVAGDANGWDREIIFVANDGSVRSLNGYTPTVISTPAVERFIASSTAGTFWAQVYVANGAPFWSLTTDQGTWEYNLATKAWHERSSTGATGWRAKYTSKLSGSWFALDTLTSKLLKIDPSVQTEGSGTALPVTIESGDLKEFPEWMAIPALFLDVTRGSGSMDVSWSVDGGANWSTPETISLTDVNGPARLNRLGLSSPMGLRIRIQRSDSNAFSFLGAQVPDLAPRKG